MIESSISTTDVPQVPVVIGSRDYFKLEKAASTLMATERMTQLQNVTQWVLDNANDPEAQMIIPSIIALANETDDIVIQHHYYRFFRQLLYKSPIMDNSRLSVLSVPPEKILEVVEGKITRHLSIIQRDPVGRR